MDLQIKICIKTNSTTNFFSHKNTSTAAVSTAAFFMKSYSRSKMFDSSISFPNAVRSSAVNSSRDLSFR